MRVLPMGLVKRMRSTRVRARWCVVTCLSATILLAMAAVVPSAVFGAPNPVGPAVYVVAWGDTLSTIALRYGTTVSAIAQANQIANANLILVGQQLVIPEAASSPSTGSGIYVVQRGDTLSAIAARYGATVHQLVQMNGLANPNFILVGQRLAVPQGATSDPNGDSTTYRVQRGDTLIGIATRFHVNMLDIVLANNIANPSLIYAGQLLTIPGTGSPSGSTPTPLPAATRSPAATPLPTGTPAPQPPTVTPAGPTPPPASSYEFRYVQGSMRQYPNCGTVYFKGKITGVRGEPVNGRVVRLRFAGNTYYKVSGVGEDPGQWGFSPLASEHFHSPFVFQIDIVESQASPVPQSDMLEIRFTDCSVAGQFENILFEYARGAPPATGSPTSVPTQNTGPTSTPANPPLPVEWDPRLNELPCVGLLTVQDQGIQLRPGDRYWRLVRVRWLNEEESRRDIQIYVDLLDEAGQRVFGETVIFGNGGIFPVVSEPQSCCPPWDYPVKWPMFNVLCSYSAHVEGLPSDKMIGMGLGTPEHPDWTVHTGFILTFQRSVYQ